MSELLTNGAVSGELDQVAADVVAEITDRLHAGEPVDVEAYAARHPELADRLRRLLPALQILDRLSSFGRPGATARGADDGEEIGRTLGDFRLIREVGRGGMGVVYEAEQLSLGRRVALKVLPFAATMDGRQLQRFQNEARAAAGLHHTNIVPVYAVGCERGVHYYAMQLIEGRTLAEFIAQQRGNASSPGAAGLSAATVTPAAQATSAAPRDTAYFRRAAEWVIQAAEALDCAHSLGVVHRDVKPANLLVDTGGRLWVTDFGLAQMQSDARVTLTGDLVGTLRYMSPEQALAMRLLIDHRTDVYSLGATLNELLTLQPAFPGSDRQELLRQIAFDEPQRPRRINPTIPAELETIVLKALEKDPADRYATAQAFAEDLRRYLMHEPIRARRSSLVQRVWKVARRHPGVTVTATAATVVGLLLGVAGLAVNNRMVRQEQLRTQAALTRAEQEKAIAQAVDDFLRNKLLSQADPRAQADAVRRGGGKAAGLKANPTIRELLDRAASELAPDRIEGQFPGQPLVQAVILRTIGEAYSGIGDYGPAISHLERARELQAQELASDHPDTLATMHSLGRTRLDGGRAEEAAQILERVRDRRSEALGPDHPDTLASMEDLLRCYHRLGRRAQALALREDLYRLRRSRLGPDHPDTLASMSHLANSCAVVGRVREALQLHEEALELRKRKLGQEDPDTLDSANNLANCHAALGQFAEALKLHQETLERRSARLGPDHPDTLQSMNNAATACSALGRHAEALKLHQQTLVLRQAKLHIVHPHTLQSMNAVAWILANCPDRTLRDPDHALDLAKQVVKQAPDKGDYWNTLGTAQYRAGDWKGAVGTLTRSMKLREGGDGADWFFLAMANWRLGQKEEARSWYDRAVQWVAKQHPEDEELRCFRAEAAELLGIDPP
jgi:serine/threonine protein kinase